MKSIVYHKGKTINEEFKEELCNKFINSVNLQYPGCNCRLLFESNFDTRILKSHLVFIMDKKDQLISFAFIEPQSNYPYLYVIRHIIIVGPTGELGITCCNKSLWSRKVIFLINEIILNFKNDYVYYCVHNTNETFYYLFEHFKLLMSTPYYILQDVLDKMCDSELISEDYKDSGWNFVKLPTGRIIIEEKELVSVIVYYSPKDVIKSNFSITSLDLSKHEHYKTFTSVYQTDVDAEDLLKFIILQLVIGATKIYMFYDMKSSIIFKKFKKSILRNINVDTLQVSDLCSYDMHNYFIIELCK
jgi:hypothetical protein